MSSSPASDPAASSPAPEGNRRGRFVLTPRRCAALWIVALLAGGGAAAWWWHVTTRPEYLLQRGQEALRNGDTELAWQSIDALALRGHDQEAALLQGDLQFRTRRFAEALATLNRITDQGELHIQAVFLSGRCLLELGACVEAERVFLYLLSLRPDAAQTHQGLAAAYYDLGALPQAAAACEAWARLQPQAGAPHRFRGIILKDLTRHADAADAYRAALERDLPAEQRREVTLELASAYLKLNQSAQALAALAPLLHQSDARDDVLLLQAECLRGLGRAAEAAPNLDRLLERSPTSVPAQRLRAVFHLDQGEFAQAAALLEKAVRLAPRDRELRVHLSQAYAGAGNPEAARKHRLQADELEKTVKALTELTQRLPRDHRNPALHLEMASLYEQLDLTSLAAKCRHVAALLQKAARP